MTMDVGQLFITQTDSHEGGSALWNCRKESSEYGEYSTHHVTNIYTLALLLWGGWAASPYSNWYAAVAEP